MRKIGIFSIFYLERIEKCIVGKKSLEKVLGGKIVGMQVRSVGAEYEGQVERKGEKVR